MIGHMARHAPARELHLSGTTGDPAGRRDLIDASAVTDSLNALPGFRSSAGESRHVFPL